MEPCGRPDEFVEITRVGVVIVAGVGDGVDVAAAVGIGKGEEAARALEQSRGIGGVIVFEEDVRGSQGSGSLACDFGPGLGRIESVRRPGHGHVFRRTPERVVGGTISDLAIKDIGLRAGFEQPIGTPAHRVE